VPVLVLSICAHTCLALAVRHRQEQWQQVAENSKQDSWLGYRREDSRYDLTPVWYVARGRRGV
jgi:hypothetical protein